MILGESVILAIIGTSAGFFFGFAALRIMSDIPQLHGYIQPVFDGLMLFGVSQVTAVSAGLLAHMMMVVPVIVAGVVLLWTENVRWGDLISGARQFRQLGDESATRLEGLS